MYVEAQFVLADDTKYHHVVALQDLLSTRRVMTLLRDPPTRGKYTALKALLLRLYSLSDAKREKKLLFLLLQMDDGEFLFTHVFVQQMPVRGGLANSPLLAVKDYRSLAEKADRILMATRSFGIQAIVPDSPMSVVAGIAAPCTTEKGCVFGSDSCH